MQKSSKQYFFSFIYTTLTYSLCFFVLYIISRHVFVEKKLVFYHGILTILISFLLISSISLLLHHFSIKLRSKLRFDVVFPSIICSTLLIYAFHVTIPTILNRSISTYIIASIVSNKNDNTAEEITQNFLDGYIADYSAVCRRINEQQVSGNITIKNNKYVITKRGAFIHSTLSNIADMLNLDTYFIKGNLGGNNNYPYKVVDNICVSVE
jgi:hypothetical protein